jgi:trans-aconitate methyltransferase
MNWNKNINLFSDVLDFVGVYGKLNKLAKERNRNVVCIGCRKGDEVEMMNSYDIYNVIGVEAHNDYVKQALELGREVLCLDLSTKSRDFLPDNISAVFARHSFEHINYLPKLIEVIYKKMIQGGMIFSVVPKEENNKTPHKKPHNKFSKHVNFFETEKEFEKLFKNKFNTISLYTKLNKKPQITFVGKKI